MPWFTSGFVLMSAMFLMQTVGTAKIDVTGLLENLNMLSKQLDNIRQLIPTEQTHAGSSNEKHKHNLHEDYDSDILVAKSTLRRAFEDEKRLHREKYSKLEFAISRLDKDIEFLKEDKIQVLTELPNLVQGLKEVKSDVRKEQEKTSIQIAELGQKVDEFVKENKRFMATQNQSTDENSQTIAALEQRDEDLKKHILAAVNDIVENAVESHVEKYKTLIEEAVDTREKCQSGDNAGPVSFPDLPSYPFIIHTVWFQPPFKNTPAFVYGLKVLDSNKNTNVRVSAYIVELTNMHFKLAITSWHDTVMYAAEFSWMACPK